MTKTIVKNAFKAFTKFTVILPIFMLMFVVAARNYEAKAHTPQVGNNSLTPNALYVWDGGTTGNHLVHIGMNTVVTNLNQTGPVPILTFGSGINGANYGVYSMSAERNGFRIGRASNMQLPPDITVVDGGRDLLTLNSNGVVGINLNTWWLASQFQTWNNVLYNNVRFRVNGSMVVGATWYASDRRYKTGIASINTSKNLFGLNSVQYNPSSEALKEQLENFKNRSKDFSEEEFKSTVSSFEKQIAELDKDNSLHFGFIAQDLQKLFPNLVIEDEQGFLAVNYVGLIPVLVDAIQEQQKTLEEQHKMLEAQQRQINELLSKGFEKSGTNSFLNDARLEQNSPNPFNSSTEIKFYVPENSTVAGIHIYDMTGKELLRLDAPRGNSSVTLDARQLNAGMYLYSLIIDGREIDTKRMILTNN